MDNTKLIIRKIMIIFGLILLAISIAIGVSIIIFSFKFMKNLGLLWWQYMLAVIGLAIAGFIVGVLGILLIYISVDTGQG